MWTLLYFGDFLYLAISLPHPTTDLKWFETAATPTHSPPTPMYDPKTILGDLVQTSVIKSEIPRMTYMYN